MTEEKNSLPSALADVRRAYRIVAAYQRRILDITKLIDDAFANAEHYYWNPVQYRSPPQGRTNFAHNYWGWMALPLYDVSFLRVQAGLKESYKPTKGSWMLEYRFQADTGYVAEGKEEPDPQKFESADSCKTTLSLIAWKHISNYSAFNYSNWYEVWAGCDWPDEYDENKTYEENTTQLMLSKNLEDLSDKAKVTEFCNQFRTACTEKLHIKLESPAK